MISNKTSRRLSLGGFGFSLALAAMAAFAGPAQAKVTGVCSNCHTMHNSQGGAGVVIAGTDAGWNGSGAMTGGTNTGPQQRLLVTNCVGCHSSTTDATIVTIGDSRIPIVYNSGGVAPAQPLAGGNFYYVENNGDQYGHNVRGISGQDQLLDYAPGSFGCANSCHQSLTLPDYNATNPNGCQGCHQSVKHHGADPAVGQPPDASGGWYRFLSAPSGHTGVGGAGVTGIEDPNWEQNPNATNHNIYYGGTGAMNESPESIGKFCGGCHVNFHAPGGVNDVTGEDNGGSGGSPWLRHPTDVEIPNDGEYAAVINSAYNPNVPVGKPNLGAYNAALIQQGDKVICISCHRAHGSPYPDMLRWSYNGMIAHDNAAAAGTGCFKCHTTKDDV